MKGTFELSGHDKVTLCGGLVPMGGFCMVEQGGKGKEYLGECGCGQCWVLEVNFANGDLLSYSGCYTIGYNNYIMCLVMS